MSVHVTHIVDGEPHFHELADEVYYVIEGEGHIELDGVVHSLRQGSTVYIPAGVTHRGWGEFTTLVIVNPPFDPDDEIVVGR
jgi:mannose-6-phosphate isomerase-like protein (cupin superfamily)